MNAPRTGLEAQLDIGARSRKEAIAFLALACDESTVHGVGLTSCEARAAARDYQDTCDPDQAPQVHAHWAESLATTYISVVGAPAAVQAVLRALIFEQPADRRPALADGVQEMLTAKGLWIDVEAEGAAVEEAAWDVLAAIGPHRMGAA